MTDYISREALPAANMNDNDYADGWNECLEAINAIPAADVREVKRGKWKDVEEDMCLCTSCRIVYLFQYATRKESAKVIHGFNFCPNCGAWMEER